MKIGDKVKVVNVTKGDCNGFKINEIGNIAEIDDDPTEYITIRVKFDMSNKGVWFRPENLELL